MRPLFPTLDTNCFMFQHVASRTTHPIPTSEMPLLIDITSFNVLLFASSFASFSGQQRTVTDRPVRIEGRPLEICKSIAAHKG
jgi:hypothetical protein